MNSWIHVLASFAGALTAGKVLLFLIRATTIAVAGRAVLAMMPRASAASRHLAATVTLAALVALPLAMAVVPQWRLPILPSRAASTIVTPAPGLQLTTPETFVRRTYDSFDGDAPNVALAPKPAPHANAFTMPKLPALPRLPLPWPMALAVLCLGVSEALLLRCAVSLLAAGWFARGATPLDDSRVYAALDEARTRIGLGRDVDVRVTGRVAVPVVAGVLHPTLLLPDAALAWPDERLKVVFLHELAHVQRCDAMSILVARAAAAFYWFHPLVRSLVRDARRECEQACDDRVLESGVRASAYAEHLLTIARNAAGHDPLGGAVLAIARPSNLEQRLASILRGGVRRGRVSRRTMAIAAVLGLGLLLPLATVRVTAAAPRARHASDYAWPSEHSTSATRTATRTSTTTTTSTSTVSSVSEPDAPAPPDAPEAADAPADPDPNLLAGNQEWSTWDDRSGADWYSRAKRNYDRERYADAGDAYERAAKAGHNIATAYYNAACSYALAHNHDKALSMLEAAVHSGWDDVHMLKSDDDLDSIRNDPRFRSILDEARNSDSDDSDRKSADAEFEALRSSNSDDADDWGSVGVDLMHSGDPAKAVTAFENQIRLEPGSNAVYNLACAYAINGQKPEALDALQRAILAGYGDADHMRDDDDLEALHGEKRFDDLLQLTENLELNTLELGDNAPRAWRDELPRYARVAQQYPQFGRAWFNLGFAQLRARQFEDSRSSFGKALDLKFRPPTTMYNLACVSAQMHDNDAAIRWLERAESAGMDVGNYLWHDRDLDPLRSDSRFRAMQERTDDAKWDKGRHKLEKGLEKIQKAFDKL